MAILAPGKLAEATGRTAAPEEELLLDRTMAAAPPPSSGRAADSSVAVRLLRSVDRSPGRYLARFAELVLIASVAIQCATLYESSVTPLRPPGQAASKRLEQVRPAAILSSYDSVFGGPGGAGAPALAATGLELHGVRQDGRTGRGSAIISEADGPQRSFGVGEAISPGLVLKDVGPGYATIARHGVDERLAFADFGPPIAGARAPPAPRPATRTITENRPRAPAGSSINFADPSTLPASLNPPIG